MYDTLFDISTLTPDDIVAHHTLKQILKGIRDRVTLLQKIILANPFPVAIWNRDGFFVAGNQGYRDLFTGTPPAEYSVFRDSVIQGWPVYKSFLEIKRGDILTFPAMPYNSRLVRPDYPDNPVWFETTITPIVNEEDQIECYIFHYVDVTEIKQLADENIRLIQKAQEAKEELRQIIATFERTEKENRTIAIHEIQRLVLPFLQKIGKKESIQPADLEELQNQLSKTPDTYYRQLVSEKNNLTSAEIRICELVRTGLPESEIAEILSIAPTTLKKHKQRIRKKFGLTNTSDNLKTFLQHLS